MGKTWFSLMGGAWEEVHPRSQKEILQKPTITIKLDALKFVPINSYWGERDFKNLKGWGSSEDLFENRPQYYQQ